MVELREARKTAARIGSGLQHVLKEARVFDAWASGKFIFFQMSL